MSLATLRPCCSMARSYATVAGLNTIGVVGMGAMGHGIAQITATSGYKVVAVDISSDMLSKGIKAIEDSLGKAAAKQVKDGKADKATADKQAADIRARITTSGDIGALSSCDLIVESIIEDLSIKKKFFTDLGKIAGQNAILSSNTSSFPITQLGEATGRSANFLGLHFFNPVPVMKLCEVIKTAHTKEDVYKKGFEFAKSIGKEPVACGDTPGFIVNRLLVPFLAQGLLMLERGVASIEDIDTAMVYGAGMPMGPLTLADYVGLDVCIHILEGWTQRYPNEPAFVIPKPLLDKVSAGKLGRKTGEGFWKWAGDKPVSPAK